jgi:GNAT superfamily N-acetyltransferase
MDKKAEGDAEAVPALAEDLAGVRRFLSRDPLVRARIIREVFHNERPVDVYADDPAEPRFVMAVPRGGWNSATMWSEDHGQLPDFLGLLPRGKWFFGSVQRDLAPAILEELADVEENESSHMYAMAREDFRPRRLHEVRPLRPEEAAIVDEYWEIMDEAEEYIRARIERGIAMGAEVDGELVAWDLTHFETDEAVMLGMLHVKEEYRRKGYAWSVGTAVVEAVLQKGKTPVCYVYTWNEPSIRFTLAIGFRRIDTHHWISGTLA